MSRRLPVYLVTESPGHFLLPLALGIIEASCRAHVDPALRDRLDLPPAALSVAGGGSAGGAGHLALLQLPVVGPVRPRHRARGETPQSGDVTIHGGPSVPKRAEARDAFLRSAPQVDIAVRGEEELTAAGLLDRLAPALERGGDWRESSARWRAFRISRRPALAWCARRTVRA
jgi:hypothetical protein